MAGLYNVEEMQSYSGEVHIGISAKMGDVDVKVYFWTNPQEIMKEYQKIAPLIEKIDNSYNGGSINPQLWQMKRDRWFY